MFEKKTIGEQIRQVIREAIINLKYAPGEKLSDAQIAKQYGVSRGPVRVAFAHLEKEGLVSIRPQYGTFVSEISIQKALDIIDVRILLEIHAVRIAAVKITQSELNELDVLFKQLSILDDSVEEKRSFINSVDTRLHEIIHKACGNEIIPAVIKNYSAEIQRIRKVNIRWADRMEPTQTEMRKIFYALKERDPEVAAAAMQEHLNNIKKAIILFKSTKENE